MEKKLILSEQFQICRFILQGPAADQDVFEWLDTQICTRGRMEVVLEDNELKEFIDNDIPKPAEKYAQNIDAWKCRNYI